MNAPLPERPGIPAGYGIHRDADGLLDWSTAREKLTAARNYWVISADASGRPHASPVWGLWLDDLFLFSSDPTARKARNLTGPEVAVHLESGDDVVIVEGTAESLTDRVLLDRFVEAYTVKYGITVDTSNPDYGFYLVRPLRVLAWLEADFPKTATRWNL